MKAFLKSIKNPKEKLLVIAAMAIYVLIIYLSPITCPILFITGIPCPGCGLTRAWLSAFRLDFISAFSYNPMFWSVPIVYFCFLKDGKPFENKKVNTVIYTVIIAGFLITWIFKLINSFLTIQ